MSSKPTSLSYLLSLTLPYMVPLQLWGPECHHPIWLEPSVSLFSPVLCRALRAIQIVCQAYLLCLNNTFFKTPHSHCLTFILVSYLNKHIISYPVSCFLALPFYTMLSRQPCKKQELSKGEHLKFSTIYSQPFQLGFLLPVSFLHTLWSRWILFT